MVKVAPRDERGWLGLGACHERNGQPRVAIELYGAGSVVAGGGPGGSVRCLVASARALHKLGHQAAEWLDAAEDAAARSGDEQLTELVASERRRLS
jgi:hypothetical protein